MKVWMAKHHKIVIAAYLILMITVTAVLQTLEALGYIG
jgi:hypothetical protein